MSIKYFNPLLYPGGLVNTSGLDITCNNIEMEENSLWKTLLLSFISVLILSLVLIVNLCLVPILNLNHRLAQTLLDFLIALSIDSLLIYVFLHLIPKAYEDARVFAIPSVYLELMVLLGIWLFFVFEKMLQHYHHGHGHDHHLGGHNHGHANEHLSETDVCVNEAPLRPSGLSNVQSSSEVSIDSTF